MDTSIDDLVTRLQAAHAARLAPRDLPHTLTGRQVDEYIAVTARMAAALSVLRNIDNDLAKPLAQIADLEERRAHTLAKRAELEQAIASAPDWRTAGDGRARDREYERQDQLRQQLKLLRENRLLYAPGEVYEDVTQLDARIAELNTRIAQHRAQHDAHVEMAEALLAPALLAQPVTT